MMTLERSADGDSTNYIWIIGLVVTLTLPFLTTYLVTTWQSSLALKAGGSGKRPPVVPFVVPVLGSAIMWVWNLDGFLKANVARYGPTIPFGVNLAGMRWYIISGPSAIGAFLKQSRDLTGNAVTILTLRRAFGTPDNAVDFYNADDSGMYSMPLPDSTAREENRIFYIVHSMMNTYLTRGSLDDIVDRFMSTLMTQIDDLAGAEEEWLHIPDLYVFLREHIFATVIRTLCGDHILSLNPNFVKDMGLFEPGVVKLFQGIPRWFDPVIYKHRENMLESVLRWHESAASHYDCLMENDEDGPDWEPYWGSRVVRVRQRKFNQMDKLDARARAAEDLSMIHANGFAVIASCWCLIETLSDVTLKSRVQAEISSSVSVPQISRAETARAKVDISSLSTSSLLQSIYAETLRLRVSVMIARQPIRDNFNLQGWTFKKTEWIGFMNSMESQNESVWNTGEHGEHPLKDFWSDRFILKPNELHSGPLKIPSAAALKSKLGGQDDKPSKEMQFTMEGLANTWVPYGLGPRMCPGRHFAKQQILATTAIWMSMYDIEVLMPKGWRPDLDKNILGLGLCHRKLASRPKLEGKGYEVGGISDV